METLKFKTNIKCGGCIDTVSPHLNAISGLSSWEVDTNLPEKVLTVTGETDALSNKVIDSLKGAGYQAELI